MDINQVTRLYMDGKDPDEILAAIKECDLASDIRPEDGLLNLASRNAHPEAIEYLLEKGLDPNTPPDEAPIPLYQLAKKSFTGRYRPRPGDIYKSAVALLGADSNFTKEDSQGMLSYHHAARCGNHEFLSAVLDRGLIMSKTTEDGGNNGLHLIVEAVYNPVRDLEKARQAVHEKQNEADLPEKCRSPVSLEELEKRVAELEEKLEDLFKSAVVFMKAGVDPEAKNNTLESAHQIAVRRGAKKITALLGGSLSPDEGNEAAAKAEIAKGGMTLHQAVRQHDLEAVRAIVADGADVNSASDDKGFEKLTPLDVACQTCDLDMVAALLELGADPSLKNPDGVAPVAFIFQGFIDNNLNTLRRVIEGKEPRKLLKLLVDKGFDINDTVMDTGETITCLTCKTEKGGGSGRDSVKFITLAEALRLGADIDKSNLKGQTPLMFACIGHHGHNKELQISLLQARADATLKDIDGNTALHYAVNNPGEQGAYVMAELLFELGRPDVQAVNNQGKTALDLAVEKNREDVAKLILNNM